MELGRSSEALPLLEDYVVNSGPNRDDYYRLGLCLLDAERQEEALEAFESSLEGYSQRPIWFPAFVRLLTATGRQEEIPDHEKRYPAE